MAARSLGAVPAQPAKASSAATTASSTCSGAAAATTATCEPVAGSRTSSPDPRPVTSRPPINNCVCMIVSVACALPPRTPQLQALAAAAMVFYYDVNNTTG